MSASKMHHHEVGIHRRDQEITVTTYRRPVRRRLIKARVGALRGQGQDMPMRGKELQDISARRGGEPRG